MANPRLLISTGKLTGDSLQALVSAGIDFEVQAESFKPFSLSEDQMAQALALTQQVRTALAGQVEGWMKRSLFERQWMLRDFKNYAGMPADVWFQAGELPGRAPGQSDRRAEPAHRPAGAVFQALSRSGQQQCAGSKIAGRTDADHRRLAGIRRTAGIPFGRSKAWIEIVCGSPPGT